MASAVLTKAQQQELAAPAPLSTPHDTSPPDLFERVLSLQTELHMLRWENTLRKNFNSLRWLMVVGSLALMALITVYEFLI